MNFEIKKKNPGDELDGGLDEDVSESKDGILSDSEGEWMNDLFDCTDQITPLDTDLNV